MSVTGQKKPPYHREGTAQCIASIRQNCAKLQAIFGEILVRPCNYNRLFGMQIESTRALYAVERIESCLLVLDEVAARIGRGDVETSGEERE